MSWQVKPTTVGLLVIAGCFVVGVVGLYVEMTWLAPVACVAICWTIWWLRFGLVREMLQEGEAQRKQLAESHASLADAHARLRAAVVAHSRMGNELRQAHKLEAVGRLAAGVAHEINTPIQYVSDSLHFVRDAVVDLTALVEKYQAHFASGGSGLPKELHEAESAADLTYLLANVPRALDRAVDGIARVATIVRSMKQFAHPDRLEMEYADLNQAIESTLAIARNEYKYVADLLTDLGELPLVRCHLGDINQAILNSIVNAAQAIAVKNQGSNVKGRIVVKTRREDDHVRITVADTGTGIAELDRERIFEPFFTTKEVGQGTGQGLAIARAVVAEKHAGSISFESVLGKGTTFHIRLRIDGPPQAQQEAA